MQVELRKHTTAYTILIIGLALATIAFMTFWPHRFFQRLTILFLMLFYISWGSITHFKSSHFTKEVFYEYVGVALLGGLLLFLLTF